jgi:importin subunit alpha-1
MPPLIRLLDHGEFDIRKEAVWAISNATSGGTALQIRFMVARGVIPPLCRLLQVPDPKVVVVALEGLDNILKAGASTGDNAENEYVHYMEEHNATEVLDKLQYSDHKGACPSTVHLCCHATPRAWCCLCAAFACSFLARVDNGLPVPW